MKFEAVAACGRRFMKLVRPRTSALVVLASAVALFVSMAPLAQAGGQRAISHVLTATVEEVDIHAGPVPSAGSTAIAAATIQSTPGGSGAQVTHLAFTGPTGAPATFGFTARATAFFASGSFSLAVKGTLVVGSGGKLNFAGKGKITGGTGRYKRAKGRVTFTGGAPNAGPGHVDTFRYRGTISY
jgi:hypothetical protein